MQRKKRLVFRLLRIQLDLKFKQYKHRSRSRIKIVMGYVHVSLTKYKRGRNERIHSKHLYYNNKSFE